VRRLWQFGFWGEAELKKNFSHSLSLAFTPHCNNHAFTMFVLPLLVPHATAVIPCHNQLPQAAIVIAIIAFISPPFPVMGIKFNHIFSFW
jgi:hypothetical protein